MKARFTAQKIIHGYVEETEDGRLVEHQAYAFPEEEIEAEILEMRKHTVKLQLPDGNVIIKKVRQVEVLND